jgi:hypothetical protein
MATSDYGVTVTDAGRIFANFPRWRNGVKNSVVEITQLRKAQVIPMQPGTLGNWTGSNRK